MREQLHTIPVNEAFTSGDECPFCYLQRQAEQRIIRYVAGPGASYMEPDMREITNKMGFCPAHLKKLYDYGNTLGNALMLQTYYARLLERLHDEIEAFEAPAPKKLFSKPGISQDGMWKRLQQDVDSCYICDRLDANMERYYYTFFALLKEAEFRSRVENCKGFCLHHFAQLLHQAEEKLPNAHRQWFYDTVFSLMEENMRRVKEDLDHLVEMYDYRSVSKDWGNSRDALPRTMQKLGGGHPSDKPYKME